MFLNRLNGKCQLKLCLYSILFVLLFFGGCFPGADLIGEYEKDISNRQELWGGYAKGEKYVLLYDIFLEEEEFPTKMRKYAGVPPRELTQGVYSLVYGPPDSIRVYLESPEQWPEIIGIIKAGTKIECTKIIGWGSFTWPMSRGVYATILDGPFAGKSINTEDLSITSWIKSGKGEDYVYYPNYGLLKRISANE